MKVELPANPTPEQKREALRNALQGAGIPSGSIEAILDLLDVDDEGRVFITNKGMERLEKLLEDLEIPEGAAGAPLAAFKAMLGGKASLVAVSGTTAVVFFGIPESFVGKASGHLQIVKALSVDGEAAAEVFVRVFSLEQLSDGCSAVVEAERTARGSMLTRVLGGEDKITAGCLVVLAIRDGGRFDLDGTVNGSVTDPAFLLEGRRVDEPDVHGGGSGCASGGAFSPSLLVLLAPLALLACGRRR